MSPDAIAQLKRRIPLWAIGVLVATSWMLVGPADAVAGLDTCDNDTGERADLPVDADTDATSVASIDDPAPCPFDSADSPSYNVCFAANPHPLSTMPKWLARMQGERTASGLFDEIEALYADYAASVPPVASAHRPSVHPDWIESLVHELRSLQQPGPARACFEGSYDEQCNYLPSEAVLVTAGSAPPVHPSEQQLNLPTPLDDDHRAQRPLVELRVGPSAGHDSPPDRPPPS